MGQDEKIIASTATKVDLIEKDKAIQWSEINKLKKQSTDFIVGMHDVTRTSEENGEKLVKLTVLMQSVVEKVTIMQGREDLEGENQKKTRSRVERIEGRLNDMDAHLKRIEDLVEARIFDFKSVLGGMKDILLNKWPWLALVSYFVINASLKNPASIEALAKMFSLKF